MNLNSGFLIFYSVMSWSLGFWLSTIAFEHPNDRFGNTSPFEGWTFWPFWGAAALGFFLAFWGHSKWSRNLAAFIAFSLAAYLYVQGTRDALGHRHPSTSTIALWIMILGWVIQYEMNLRSRRWELGNWVATLVSVVGALFAFSTLYFPYMKPSLGGGSQIPVTIEFTMQSTVMPNQVITAKLIDESDAGLYVVGNNDKKGTFIPRNEIGLIYYSNDTSGSFLPKPR